jgi:hypothetical protein
MIGNLQDASIERGGAVAFVHMICGDMGLGEPCA